MNIKGKTIKDIVYQNEEIVFTMEDDTKYRMMHYQDCCESVSIDWGSSCNLEDLNGETIIDVEEDSVAVENPEYDGSQTTTTYTINTTDGSYLIVWEGISNGYYSETPSFEELK
jgi:hypothetical protein